MTQKDLIKGISIEGIKLTKEQKEVFIKDYEDAILKVVESGKKVKTGLGTFENALKKGREIKERDMFNPKINKNIHINAQIIPDKRVLKLKTKIAF